MASDNNYAYPLIVAMTSILENKNPDTKIDFYIMLSGDFLDENKTKIMSLQSKYSHCRITLIDMKDKFKSANTCRKHITRATYYRLELPNLCSNVDKIIWLDCDTLTLKDLTEMFEINIDDFYFKGFLDNNINGCTSFGIESDNYICAGVMLINLKALRKNNMQIKFSQFIRQNNKKLVQQDQTVINVLCYDKIDALPPIFGIWNFKNNRLAQLYAQKLKKRLRYSNEEMEKAFYDPTVLHLVYNKPWNHVRASRADLWWDYAKKTDYFNEIVAKYKPAPANVPVVTPVNKAKSARKKTPARLVKAKTVAQTSKATSTQVKAPTQKISNTKPVKTTKQSLTKKNVKSAQKQAWHLSRFTLRRA